MSKDLHIQVFTFNAYQENTYLLYTDAGDALVIDPGCYSAAEETRLNDFITQKGLTLRYLVNTHGHIDHMLGNRMVKTRYQVPFLAHRRIRQELEAVPGYAPMMGMQVEPSPLPDQYLDAGDTLTLGEHTFDIYFTPGHSPSHISLFHAESGNLFSGDVLFRGSIGRTDLPGGSMPVLMESIFTRLLPLGDAVTVWPGHGPETTLGAEKRNNPFILEYQRLHP